MMHVGVLVHELVRLEPLSLEHVPGLTAAATRDRSGFLWAPVPADESGMRAYVEHALAEAAADRAVPFVMKRPATGEIVGSTRFMSLEWWSWPPGPVTTPGDPRVKANGDPPDVAEVGSVWFATDAQRTGMNTAMFYIMAKYAFDTWKVHRLVWKTDARNVASRESILKMGGTFEGILRSHLPAIDGVIRDTAMFSVIESEWPAVRERLDSRLAPPQNGLRS